MVFMICRLMGIAWMISEQELADNDIPDIIERWDKKDQKKAAIRKAKSFCTKKEIEENGYDLSLNRYKGNGIRRSEI